MGIASYCETERYWPLNTALFVEDFRGNDPRFVFHLFQMIDLTGFNSGSVQPMLNRNYIRNVAVSIPDVEEQRAISAVFKAIDDKIASNGTMAEVGEKLAFAIASDVRWTEIAPLRNIVSQVRKQVAPESVASDVVAHYSLPSFDAGQLPEIVPPAVIKSAKFLVSEPAVLLSKLNPVTPRVWSVEPDQCLPALASTEFMVLKPVDGVTPDEIWAVTKQPIFTSDLVGLATGTSNSHQRVRPDDVLATHVVDPRSLPVVDRAVITSVAKRCRKARSESRALAELRDALLPKLMSGEIRVRDAEKAVEDAV